MKNFMSMMLALSLLTGVATVSFGQAPAEPKKEDKKKDKKKKETKPAEEKPA